MREIKFRAFDKKQMQMYLSPNAASLGDLGAWFEAHSGKYGWNKDGDSNLMQYTGLKDKNGKEIFEGDIISMVDRYFGDQLLKGGMFKIAYEDGALGVYDNKDNYECSLDDATIYNNSIDIIGNIYENPEMVK